jgi:hypothetical protein
MKARRECQNMKHVIRKLCTDCAYLWFTKAWSDMLNVNIVHGTFNSVVEIIPSTYAARDTIPSTPQHTHTHRHVNAELNYQTHCLSPLTCFTSSPLTHAVANNTLLQHTAHSTALLWTHKVRTECKQNTLTTASFFLHLATPRHSTSNKFPTIVDTLQQLHKVMWLKVHPQVRNESFVPRFRYRIGGRHKPHTIPLPTHCRIDTFASTAKFSLGQTVTVTACICGYNMLCVRHSNNHKVLRARGRTQRVNWHTYRTSSVLSSADDCWVGFQNLL